jgi:arylsulfatase
MKSLLFTIALFTGIISSHAAESPAASKPNVIIILADDLGYSDLGCYGSEIATPNLDALAKEGLRFSQFYNSARCWPTRAALLTGYYPQQIRRDRLPTFAGGMMKQRPAWAPLLPALLKSAGYRSYHSGKWHIDGSVLASGFDRSCNIVNGGNFFTNAGTFINDKPLKPVKSGPDHYITITTANFAIECLKDHAAQTPGKPFFQYIAFHAPHFPLHALPADIAKYRDKYLVGWDSLRQSRYAKQKSIGLISSELSALEHQVGPPAKFPEAQKPLLPHEVFNTPDWSDITPAQQQFQAAKMAIHAAMVDRMDQEIGRIIAQLKAMNAYENTLILFASDNGASAEIMIRDGGHDPHAELGSATTYPCLGPGFSSAANTPFRRHKSWVHEGGISTPLIVHWPRLIKSQNALRHTPAHVIDVVPTILELAGVTKPQEWQGTPVPPAPGKSLVAAFANDTTIERESLWWLHEGNRASRVGDWKLVALRDHDWELYNLANDRTEQHNLASQHPDRVKTLSDLWEKKTQAFTEMVK